MTIPIVLTVNSSLSTSISQKSILNNEHIKLGMAITCSSHYIKTKMLSYGFQLITLHTLMAMKSCNITKLSCYLAYIKNRWSTRVLWTTLLRPPALQILSTSMTTMYVTMADNTKSLDIISTKVNSSISNRTKVASCP